jgi:hypothetical protein
VSDEARRAGLRCHASKTPGAEWWRGNAFPADRCEADATHHDYDLRADVCGAHIVQPEYTVTADQVYGPPMDVTRG